MVLQCSAGGIAGHCNTHTPHGHNTAPLLWNYYSSIYGYYKNETVDESYATGMAILISPEMVATWARLLGTMPRCSRCQMYDDCIVLHDCVLVIWRGMRAQRIKYSKLHS